jgi:hypothetical protein
MGDSLALPSVHVAPFSWGAPIVRNSLNVYGVVVCEQQMFFIWTAVNVVLQQFECEYSKQIGLRNLYYK